LNRVKNNRFPARIHNVRKERATALSPFVR
jgi:hypothetical protein